MLKVLQQYYAHMFRILHKAKLQGRVDDAGCSILTPAEKKGYAYYRTAAESLKRIIEQ